MTTWSIELGQELTIPVDMGVLNPGDQVVTNGHGNGNALGNTLVPEGVFVFQTVAEFVDVLTKSGLLERGHTYVAHTLHDSALGNQPAELVVTETQSGKIGGLEIATNTQTFSFLDHVLTFT
jgi:hypothetical protein